VTSARLGAERAVGPLPFLIWLASILLVTGALVDRARLQPLATWRAWVAAHRAELAVVGAITLAGFLLRVAGSGDAPYTVSGFEGAMGLEMRAALAGDLTNRFTLGWGALPTMAYWTLSWPVTFFGAQLSVLRLMPALFGALSIPATYALARLLFDRRIALIAALFVLGQHASLHFSRIITVQIADVFWVALVLVLLVLARRTRDPLLWFATGLAAGAASYFFQGARVILVIITLYVLALELRSRGEGHSFLREHARHLALLGLGTLLVAGPLWAAQAQHGARFGPRLFEQSALDSGWLDAERQRTGADTLGVLLNSQVLPSLQAFIMLPDKGATYRGDMPILDYTSGLFFVLGLAYALMQLTGRRGESERGDQPYALVQIGLWTPVLLISVLTTGVPNVGRFLMVLPFVAILVGIGVVQVVELLLRALGRTNVPRTALYALIAVVLVLANLNYYFRDYIPSAVYADLNSHAAAAIGRTLYERGPGVRAYFFGPPRLFANSEIIKVLAYDVETVEIPPGAALPEIAADKTPLFIALPERQGELAAVQQRYPGGRSQAFWSPYRGTATDARMQQEPLFVSYEVSGP
jgi:4-amino-4-deoxy-L-arabinose transferase-like glycosyltransferase